MVQPIETARQAMDILMEHDSVTPERLSRTTYAAGILTSALNGVRVVLLTSAGEHARGFTRGLMDHMQRRLDESSEVETVVVGWVNTVEGGCTEFPAGGRAAGNDAEQQMLRLGNFERAEDHECHTEGDGLQISEELLSNRSSDSSYTPGDWIPDVHLIRHLLVTRDESPWVGPILALKTSRVFCPSCTEAVESEGLQIDQDDRTEAVRPS